MKDWLKLQKDLYVTARSELKKMTQPKPRNFQAYERRYLRDLDGLKKSSFEEFYRSQRRADCFLIGDFHSFRQSQKQLLRLLKDPRVRKPKSLGLETLPLELESELQGYLKKPSPQKLKKLQRAWNLEEHWGSSWDTYKAILSLCQELKIQVYSLGSTQASLEKRDQMAARRALQQARPSWLFIGEMHCARPHLARLLRLKSPDLEVLSLQQNEDRLALKHLKQMKTKSSLMFLSQHPKLGEVFCLLHTLPWVKWQSDLNFKIRQEEGYSELDPHDQILWSLRTLKDFFEDRRYPSSIISKEAFDFQAISSSDEDFLEALEKLSAAEQNWVLEQLELEHVAVLSRQRRIFLSEVSLNSCAQAASLLLISHWQQKQYFEFNFYRTSFLHALSFFLSKILNHRRKSPSWDEWRKSLKRNGEQHKLDVLWRSRNFYRWGLKAEELRFQKQEGLNFAAHALGRWLADQCFEAFLAGEFSKQRLTRICTSSFQSEEIAYLRLCELWSLARDFRSEPN